MWRYYQKCHFQINFTDWYLFNCYHDNSAENCWLAQIMSMWCLPTNDYLRQRCTNYMTPHGVTMPHWVSDSKTRPWLPRTTPWNAWESNRKRDVQYIPRNMHTVFALLCFVVVIHWLIFPYPSGLLHWHCGNLTIVPVPAKQPWWIWINTSCEFIMNDCITTTWNHYYSWNSSWTEFWNVFWCILFLTLWVL